MLIKILFEFDRLFYASKSRKKLSSFQYKLEGGGGLIFGGGGYNRMYFLCFQVDGPKMGDL